MDLCEPRSAAMLAARPLRRGTRGSSAHHVAARAILMPGAPRRPGRSRSAPSPAPTTAEPQAFPPPQLGGAKYDGLGSGARSPAREGKGAGLQATPGARDAAARKRALWTSCVSPWRGGAPLRIAQRPPPPHPTPPLLLLLLHLLLLHLLLRRRRL